MKSPRLSSILLVSFVLFSCATGFQDVKRTVYLKDPNQKPLQITKTEYHFDFMKPESLTTAVGARLVVQQAHVSPKGTRVLISPD